MNLVRTVFYDLDAPLVFTCVFFWVEIELDRKSKRVIEKERRREWGRGRENIFVWG